jgi:hypothetical protein
MSLILAIGGVVAAIGLWLVLAVVESLTQFNLPYMLCVLLFIALEIAALITGVIGRRSSCGKPGLGISATLLVVTAIAYPFLMASYGSRSFSHTFDSEKEADLTEAARMYNSLCQELESRGFRRVEMVEGPEMKGTHYKGEYSGFPLRVEICYLTSISEEKPEFSYRVSFEQTTATDELNKAAKDLRVLMQEWCVRHSNSR